MNFDLPQSMRVIRPLKLSRLHVKSVFFLIIALVYGYVVSQLPDTHFKDFTNYLVYADRSWDILISYNLRGALAVFSNEPVWLLINSGLGLYLEPETVVRTIIFFSASSVAWLILRHYPQYFFVVVLFLLLPQVIKNFLIHLRQGVAIALFLWGWFSVNRSVRWVLLGLTPFIHSSFFIVLPLLWLSKTMTAIRIDSALRAIAYCISGLAVVIGLGLVAEMLGARQAEQYAFDAADISGLGFLLWLVLLGIMVTAGKTYLREHAFASGLIVFYLVTYWFIEVTARIFESGLIVVLLAGLALWGWRKLAFLGIVLGAGMLAWFMRLGLPTLGFAS